MKLFDVHTHVQFAAFKDDWREVIKRALDRKIWLINVGTQKDASAQAIEISKYYSEGVYAAVGLHPIHTEKSYHDEQELGGAGGFESRGEEFDYEYYKKLAENPKVVAIGECGLDYYRLGEETKKKQRGAFEKQIQLAEEIGKPLMIHCRNAFADLVDILSASRFTLQVPGTIHFFSGTKDDAKKLMEFGFSFSFGGVITFTHDYDEVIRYIELDKILLETDAPYVAPVPHRGKRNEPSYVIEVAKKIAELKKISLEEVAEITFQNAERIFLENSIFTRY
ncbi:MAG: TatD family hydrolase [Patescibacteria group bacterium]